MILKRILEIIIFFIFVIILLSHSTLLADPSKLYSTSFAHRLQTDAFLKGHLDLSPLPFGYPMDFNWSGHGLQQTWGLGVPLLRLPFEWVAVTFGFEAFPDRLVLLVYLLLTIVVLNISLKLTLTTFGLVSDSVMELLVRWYLIAWILFSPALGGLIQNRINVYHETILYACLYTYCLLSLFWVYLIKPNDRIFLALCIISGLGCLIRPTLFFYGLTAVTIACVCAYQNKRNIRLVTTGILCFCLGVSINLWSNFLRFGSIFNFGYSENFCGIPIINYGMRFDYPFGHEPFLSAAKELTGDIFFNKQWQSPTVRWRDPWDFPLFNVPYLVLLAMGFIAFIFSPLPLFLKQFNSKKLTGVYFRVIYCSLAWGIICSVLLFCFYLRLPFMNARYISEFSPAFFAIIAGLILLSIFYLTFYIKNKMVLILSFSAISLLFYISNKEFFEFNIPTFKKHYQLELTDKNGIKQLVAKFNHDILQRPKLPETSYCGQSYPTAGAMFRQYDGWRIHQDCLVSALTSAILPMKKCFTLNYSIKTIQQMPPIQVKRDLTFLKLVDSQMTLGNAQNSLQINVTQTFCSDAPMLNTVALYSIGWVSPDELNRVRNGTIPVKLNWIKVAEK